MPAIDFEQHPQLIDGYIEDGVVKGNPTQINKAWWEDELFTWILKLTESTNFPHITPADLIHRVMSGNFTTPLGISSTSVYTADLSEDDTTIHVAGSLLALKFGDEYITYEGGSYDFGVGGPNPVTFTTANYYKRINIGVTYNGTIFEFELLESDEFETIDELMDPGRPVIDTEWYYCGYAIIQNNGTLDPGEINVITQDNITSIGLQATINTGLTWLGFWDASTNDPDISTLSPSKGDYYIISKKGNISIDGITIWDAGNFIIYNGNTWVQYVVNWSGGTGGSGIAETVQVINYDGITSQEPTGDCLLPAAHITGDEGFIPFSFYNNEWRKLVNPKYTVKVKAMSAGDYPVYMLYSTTDNTKWSIVEIFPTGTGGFEYSEEIDLVPQDIFGLLEPGVMLFSKSSQSGSTIDIAGDNSNTFTATISSANMRALSDQSSYLFSFTPDNYLSITDNDGLFNGGDGDFLLSFTIYCKDLSIKNQTIVSHGDPTNGGWVIYIDEYNVLRILSNNVSVDLHSLPIEPYKYRKYDIYYNSTHNRYYTQCLNQSYSNSTGNPYPYTVGADVNFCEPNASDIIRKRFEGSIGDIAIIKHDNIFPVSQNRVLTLPVSYASLHAALSDNDTTFETSNRYLKGYDDTNIRRPYPDNNYMSSSSQFMLYNPHDRRLFINNITINAVDDTGLDISAVYKPKYSEYDTTGDGIVKYASALRNNILADSKTHTFDEISEHLYDAIKHTSIDDIKSNLTHDELRNSGSMSHHTLELLLGILYTNRSLIVPTIEFSTELTKTLLRGREYLKTPDIGSDSVSPLYGKISDFNSNDGKTLDMYLFTGIQNADNIYCSYYDEDYIEQESHFETMNDNAGYAKVEIINEEHIAPKMSYRSDGIYISPKREIKLSPHIPFYDVEILGDGNYDWGNDINKFGPYTYDFQALNISDETALHINQYNRVSDYSITPTFTFASWIYMESSAPEYGNYIISEGTGNFGIAIQNNEFIIYGINGSTWNTGITGFKDSIWHYITVIADSGTLYCWKDGINRQSRVITSIQYDTNSLYIGYKYNGRLEDLVFDRKALWSGETFIVPTVPLEEYFPPQVLDIRNSDIYFTSNIVEKDKEYTIVHNLSRNANIGTLIQSGDVKPYYVPYLVDERTSDYGDDLYNSSLYFPNGDAYYDLEWKDQYYIDNTKDVTLYVRFKPELEGHSETYVGVFGIGNYQWNGLCITYQSGCGIGIEGYRTSDREWNWKQLGFDGHIIVPVDFDDGNYHDLLLCYYAEEQKLVVWIDSKHKTVLDCIGFTLDKDIDGQDDPDEAYHAMIGQMGDYDWNDACFKGHIQECFFINGSAIIPSNTTTAILPENLYTLTRMVQSNLYISPETDNTNIIEDLSLSRQEVQNIGGVTISDTETVIGRNSLYFDGNGRLEVPDEHVSKLYSPDFTISFRLKTSQNTGTICLLSGGSTDTERAWSLILYNGTLRWDYADNNLSFLPYGMGSNLGDNNWHTILLQHQSDGSILYTFIDGAYIGAFPTSNGGTNNWLFPSNNKLTIGGNEDTAHLNLIGYMSEIFMSPQYVLPIDLQTPILDIIPDLKTGIRLSQEYNNYDFKLYSDVSEKYIDISALSVIDTITDDIAIFPKPLSNSTLKETRITWKINGTIPIGSNIDMSRLPNVDGQLKSIVLIVENTGTGGDDLVIDVIKNNTSSIFTNQPTIVANSGTFQKIVIDTFNDSSILTADYLTIDTITVPTDSSNLICECVIEY